MKKNDAKQNIPVAIVGMGCLFPRSNSLKQFWRLLFQGKDAISDIPEGTHWSLDDYFDPDPQKPDHVYCRRGGFLSPIDFDPTEFGIPPSVLESTDTSQLLSLVAAVMALSDAGYVDKTGHNHARTSVILGATGTQELAIPLGARLGHPHWRRALDAAGVPPETAKDVVQRISDAYIPWQETSFPGLLGNVIAGRISNRLNLGGTNCVVDAACASSLSAVHLSLMELSCGRADMVLTGGVDLLNDIFMHMCFSRTGVLSPTHDIRPFSKNADGIVLGEGVGIMALKRLRDAERDADTIYAVIKGVGTSSDGRSQSIYAPRREGQEKALRRAYDLAGVSPNTVGLIEAHGTGTIVGDEVEFNALKNVFNEHSALPRHCTLGSVKSMIGHAKAAAGSAGLIKTALALHYKVLPPTLKAKKPDPKLGIEESPFHLCAEARPWFSSHGHPRRAGVSAFGFGGSNFHVVLEEYQKEKSVAAWDGSAEIFAFSSETTTSLSQEIKRVSNGFKENPSDEMLACLAEESRKRFSSGASHRLLMVADLNAHSSLEIGNRLDEISATLSAGDSPRLESLPHVYYGRGDTPGKLAFLFPGQGSQYVGMARELVCVFPEAFGFLEKADDVFQKTGASQLLSDFIFPSPSMGLKEKRAQESALRQTDIAQPAIGAVSMSMARVLERFGIMPDACCGHSYGELTALCRAGWIDDISLLRLSIARGKCMAEAGNLGNNDAGTMIVVLGPLEDLEKKLKDADIPVVLANRNSPSQGVLSGPVDAIKTAETECVKWGFSCGRLPVSAAFHSDMMSEARKTFSNRLSRTRITPTVCSVYSNVSGGAYPNDSAGIKKLLRDQLISPVNFLENLSNLYEDGVRTFVEVGPRAILTGLAKESLGASEVTALSMNGSNGKETAIVGLAALLCQLGAKGYDLTLDSWESPKEKLATKRMRIPVSGANFLPKPSPRPSSAEPSTVPEASSKPKPVYAAPLENRTPESTKPEKDKGSSVMPPPHNDAVARALQVAEQGLKSMQALQLQTAEAHQKFLETQAAAAKALQEMIAGARSLTNSDAAFSPASGQDTTSPSFVMKASTGTKPDDSALPPIVPSPSPETMTPVKKASKDVPSDHLSKTLLSVVSRLTGYPGEMLGMDMDIESDLGIDSIKRVEILSAMEEAIPGLPTVSPDMMGSLKTLGQIVQHLSSEAPEASIKESPDKSSQSASAASSSASGTHIKETLLSVVSRLTGYPGEMLGMDMDIESDLGIDSIKRVEILSAMEEAIPGLPTVSPDMMGSLKTLGLIVEYLSGPNSLSATAVAAAPPENRQNDTPPCTTVGRFRVAPTESTPKAAVTKSLSLKGTVYITDDGTGLSSALAEAMGKMGVDTHLIAWDDIRDLCGQQHDFGDTCGLLLIPKPGSFSTDGSAIEDLTLLREAFSLARHIGASLLKTAVSGDALFATVTRLDGAFGFSSMNITEPVSGALAGLVKTADLEWESVRCRALDISPDWDDVTEISERIVIELLDAEAYDAVEVGIGRRVRTTLSLLNAPLADTDCPDLDLASDDVILVSGGARGVTAESAIALARSSRPTLLLLGRSPEPTEEPAWLSSLSSVSDIKAAILQHEFQTETATPKAVESVFRRYMANREITNNIEKMTALGARVEYISVDIRNISQLTDILEKVRADYGPVRGILHGAGVLEDKLILDKSEDQFNRVLETKLGGLQVLLTATRKDPLKYLILFSSVAARFGNAGQSDYAMANEAMNKISSVLASAHPDRKTIAINWGPWDGGMVTDSLKNEFARKKIDLIPMDTGARYLVEEMSAPGDTGEIVFGAPLKQAAASDAGPSEQSPTSTDSEPQPPDSLRVMLNRDIDIRQFPVLTSHQLDGIPVVPFALLTEWIGHCALHDNPGLLLQRVEDMRLLKGIRMDEERKVVRLLAGKPRKTEDGYEVDVEIRNGIKDIKEVLHSRARTLLSTHLPDPPDYDVRRIESFPTYDKSVEDVYERILFHGHALQGIQKIVGLSDRGMVAEVSPAPSPDKWLTDPMRSRWIADPLVLDSAFQMACVWCYEQQGMVSLPSFVSSFRQYCRTFPGTPVTAILEVTDIKGSKMIGDVTILDENQTVAAELKGYEAIMDTGLFKSFKPDLVKIA